MGAGGIPRRLPVLLLVDPAPRNPAAARPTPPTLKALPAGVCPAAAAVLAAEDAPAARPAQYRPRRMRAARRQLSQGEFSLGRPAPRADDAPSNARRSTSPGWMTWSAAELAGKLRQGGSPTIRLMPGGQRETRERGMDGRERGMDERERWMRKGWGQGARRSDQRNGILPATTCE